MGKQQLILYVVVAMIVGTVLFLIFNVQDRSQRASIDATQYRAAKQGMLNLVQMMELDFRNIGSYMYKDGSSFVSERVDGQLAIPHPDPGPPRQGRDSVAVEGGFYHWFGFRAQVDSLQPPVMVRYEWRPTDRSVTLSGGTERQLYLVERYVEDELTGTSANMVTSMNVQLLPDTTGTDGDFPINPELTRQIDVQITGVSPLGRGELIEQTFFESTYRPPAMSIIQDD